MKYQPPCTITPKIVTLVAEIGETIGRCTVLAYLPVETVIRAIGTVEPGSNNLTQALGLSLAFTYSGGPLPSC